MKIDIVVFGPEPENHFINLNYQNCFHHQKKKKKQLTGLTKANLNIVHSLQHNLLEIFKSLCS